MSKRFSLSFFCLLLAFFAAIPASAQQKAPQVPGAVAAPSSQEDQEPQPEPPKVVLNVEIKDDLLSVELSNVDFGPAIKAVADKAGFKIEGSGEVFGRKLNTKFTDIEIERGVLRLLTLVKESNYMLHYDTNGLISKLEIFGIDSGKAPSVASKQPVRPAPPARQPAPAPAVRQPTVPQPAQQPTAVAPVSRSRVMPPVSRRRQLPTQSIAPSQPAAETSEQVIPEPTEETNQEEATVNETPYVAPQPRFAPAVKKP
jgi:hypothetical protein